MERAFFTGVILLATVSLFAQGNTAVQIFQEGSDNIMEVSAEDVLEGSASALWIYQTGRENKAFMDQTTINTRTSVSQLGDENSLNLRGTNNVNVRTRLNQTGSGNTLLLVSSSIDSEIFLSQGMSEEEPGFNNYAEIEMAGLHQYARLTQIGEEHEVVADLFAGLGDFSIVQKGFNNGSLSNQAGNYVSLDLQQTGERNFSAVQQLGEGTVIEAAQKGNNHFSVVNQGGISVWTHVQQEGDYQALIINQSAMEGWISTRQTGLSNYLEIDQEGIFPAIEMEQDGEANSARLIQKGSYEALNTFSGSQTGNNNSISSMQSGDRGVAEVIQHGNNLNATIIQE